MKKILFLAFVPVFLTAALVNPRAVITVNSSTTSQVYPGQSIQDAIDSAQPEDTIFVHAGTYYEHLVIRKTVLLLGENPATTIIDGGGEGNVVTVRANDVAIQNFTIRNSGSDYSDVGLAITNDGAGPFFDRALISGNTIVNHVCGIAFYYTWHNNVLENTVANNTNGIILYCSSYNTISKNSIANNQQNGVRISESIHNNVSENSIKNNDECGITFYAIANNNTIYKNDIENNKYGINIKQSSHNKIYHNNLIDNTKQARIEPTQFVEYTSANTWDNGYRSGGNYWSDYTGTDADHNGIGDTPYTIDQNNQDNYPLTSPLGREEGPLEDIPPPFWMQWWFYPIVAAVIIVLVGTVFLLRKRKPRKPTANQG